MSLTKIEKDRIRRQITAYDLEWYPENYELRLVGVYDERGYRHYSSIIDFVEKEFVRENRGRYYYAHAGGLADILFVLSEFSRNERLAKWSLSASFSGSSAIIVRITYKKNSFYLVDSLWTLRDSLATIGKWYGLPKLEQDGIFEAPIEDLIIYNTRDCEILYKALTRVEDILWEMGGQLNMTLASTAMDLFRRVYLKEDIPTFIPTGKTVRKAYYSSRVEIFGTSCERAYYHDINSSFPFAMCEDLPGNFTGHRETFPKVGYYFAEVDFSVPEMYLPPLPYRSNGRIYFPTGNIHGWYSKTDIELALENGCTLNKIYWVLCFDTFTDLKDYALDIYSKRMNAQRAEQEFESKTFKLLGNSLYGKFGERREKSQFTMHPQCHGGPGTTMLAPGMIIQTRLAKVPHAHPAISVAITSIARRNLFNYMKKVLNEEGELYYTDTDSIVANKFIPGGSELGQLKLECIIDYGRFLQPKLYCIRHAKDCPCSKCKKEPGTIIVRAKGFRKLSVSDFNAIADGWSIRIQRMLRVKETLNDYNRDKMENKQFLPHEKETWKGIHLDKIMSKRFTFKNGTTRPWTVKEIDKRNKEKQSKKHTFGGTIKDVWNSIFGG